jgi:hypothetical protein
MRIYERVAAVAGSHAGDGGGVLMGVWSRAGWVAVAALAAAGGASGQPEFLRLETHSDPVYPALFDVEGNLLAWTSRPYPPSDGLVTNIYRRTGGGWALEAQLPGAVDQDQGFTVIEGDRIATTTYGFAATRVYRHDGQAWASEPVRGASNTFAPGSEIIDVSGEWLVAAPRWPQIEGLAHVYRFDGAVWRYHSLLKDPALPNHVGGWVQIEGDVLAVGAVGDTFVPASLVIFRFVDGAWRVEARVPEGQHPLDIDQGRVLASDQGQLAIYEEVAPGEWAPTARFPAATGLPDLDGDKLLTLERYDGPSPYENSCRAVLYQQAGADWVRSRTLYPSTAFGYGAAPWSIGFIQWGQTKHADGEIFVRSYDYLLGGGEYILGFSACRADLNGDGVADALDVAAFLEAREEFRMNVDYDMDGEIGFPGIWDEGDFLEFMRLLAEGC